METFAPFSLFVGLGVQYLCIVLAVATLFQRVAPIVRTTSHLFHLLSYGLSPLIREAHASIVGLTDDDVFGLRGERPDFFFLPAPQPAVEDIKVAF
jgi:hypothetical protein